MPGPRVQPNCLLVSEGPLGAGFKSTAKLSAGVRRPVGAGSKSTAKLSAGVRRASRCRVQEYTHTYIQAVAVCMHCLGFAQAWQEANNNHGNYVWHSADPAEALASDCGVELRAALVV